MVLLTLSGTSRQMKAGVSAPVAHVWTVKNRRVTRLEAFLDRAGCSIARPDPLQRAEAFDAE